MFVIILFLFLLLFLLLLLLSFLLQVTFSHKDFLRLDSEPFILPFQFFLMRILMGLFSLLDKLFHFLYVPGAFRFAVVVLLLARTLPILSCAGWMFWLVCFMRLFTGAFDLVIYLIVLVNGGVKLLLVLWVWWHSAEN